MVLAVASHSRDRVLYVAGRPLDEVAVS